MKALVLNLPHPQRIYRCYRCSINSPGFCLPPLELLYQAAVLRADGWEVDFLDAAAEGASLARTIEHCRRVGPDLIVSIMGYEHFTEDVKAVNAIRAGVQVPHYAVMGYLPSHFYEETLEHLQADLILRDEPEQTLREAAGAIAAGRSPSGIAGLAWRQDGRAVSGPPRPRMRAGELEALPAPARDLLKIELYREPFLGRPFTTFQAGRGCPYRCVFCTSTYGSVYAVRSPAHVVDEIENARRRFGIRCFRFTDDTFAVRLGWTREFCRRLVDTGHRYDWVALTRIDLMDESRMKLLATAGCRRLYVGIESGSQRVLDFYRKRYAAEQVPAMVAHARRAGIEIVGYFVVGSPIETVEDYRQTVELATRLQLDMVSVYPMMPYPDTASYRHTVEPVEFSLYPYRVQYRNQHVWDEAVDRMNHLMRRIYLSPRFIAAKLKWLTRYPGYSLRAGLEFGRWLLTGFAGRRRKTLL
jgi:radical SAM superfamily enzyme YgiQ (UPF0313 family)